MKKLLFVIYFITVADSYYATLLFIEQKTPPQHQTAQVSVQSVETAQLR